MDKERDEIRAVRSQKKNQAHDDCPLRILQLIAHCSSSFAYTGQMSDDESAAQRAIKTIGELVAGHQSMQHVKLIAFLSHL